MAKYTGGSNYTAKIKKMGPEIVKQVGAALFAAGEMVQVDAQISITDGSVSGKSHKPSKAGTAPNNDTGFLANSIETVQKSPLVVEVSANAPYAAIHEYGGTINHPGGTAYFIGDDGMAVFVPDSNILSTYLPRTKPHTIVMPERPYMRPALEKNRVEIAKMITAAVNRAEKAAGNGS
ncbi:HK97 gp10 family phage protein [Sphingobium sp. H39-3-25]|uniref:HK97 gp10 family phage protein n=1 Tax=Sphingobium arseniciresistens TaxID=3030834 RepID=UPI0023B8F3DE|nr:HK97 gp10 family phage protein [Sphingobium arseniciresistens]